MAMEASRSPFGDETQVNLKDREGSLVDLTALEESAEGGGKRGIDRVWMVLAGFLVEVALVAVALAWLRPPASVTAALAPMAVLVMGSIRFRRERLRDRSAERSVEVALRAGIVAIALTPVAVLGDALGALFGVLAVAIAASSATTFAIAGLRRGRTRRTLIVGAGPLTQELADHIVEKCSDALELIGILESDHMPAHDHPVLGRPKDLVTIARATRTDVVIVSYGPFAPEDFVSELRECARDMDVYVVPRFFELGRDSDRELDELNGFPLLRLTSAAVTRPSWRLKRLIDIVASLLLLVLFAPVMALIALAVALTSRGPVFFRQQRVGRDGALFEILKFRTMAVNDDADVTWTVENDPRVTPLGKFLRASHLDELPQLLNVLRGDMSLVGPRPERPFFVDRFNEEHDHYGDRHRVLPGISGWSQVNGLWGDTSVEARARLDNRYIEDWSLFKDIVIMLRTVPTLFKGRD